MRVDQRELGQWRQTVMNRLIVRQRWRRSDAAHLLLTRSQFGVEDRPPRKRLVTEQPQPRRHRAAMQLAVKFGHMSQPTTAVLPLHGGEQPRFQRAAFETDQLTERPEELGHRAGGRASRRSRVPQELLSFESLQNVRPQRGKALVVGSQRQFASRCGGESL